MYVYGLRGVRRIILSRLNTNKMRICLSTNIASECQNVFFRIVHCTNNLQMISFSKISQFRELWSLYTDFE